MTNYSRIRSFGILLLSALVFSACTEELGFTSNLQPKNESTPNDLPPPIDDTICDPLSGGLDADSSDRNGLLGRLTYLDSSAPIANSVYNFWNIAMNGDVTPVTPVDVDLFSHWVNTPTRSFDAGFFVMGESEPLKRDTGDVLFENFSLYYQSNLILGNEEPGEYEIAVLSDDGAVLKLHEAGDAGADLIIDNDGTHPTQMKCTTTKVTMDGDSRYPLELLYHQGPRFHVALILMWRKLSTGEAAGADSLCNQVGNHLFFDYSVSPSVPTAAYNGLLDRGWKVIPTTSYLLPGDITNPCAE